MSKTKVLVLGSIYLESQYFIDENKGELTSNFATDFYQRPGSKAINAARTFSAFDDSVDFYGFIGNDIDSEIISNSFENYKISTTILKQVETHTGKIVTITPKNGESKYIIYSGANNNWGQKDLENVTKILDNYDLLYTNSKYPPTDLYKITESTKKSVFIDFPLNHHQFDLSRFGSNVWIMPNRDELSAFTGTDIDSIKTAESVLSKLLKNTKANALVSLDNEGSIAKVSGHATCITLPIESARPTKDYDPNGLGDIFRALFARKLVELGENTPVNVERSLKYAQDIIIKLVNVKGMDRKINLLQPT